MAYYGGWAYSDEENCGRVIDAYRRVNREDILEFTKKPMYGKVRFEGRLKDGSKLTEFELLAWADGGNLCFGGDCIIKGTEFSGNYYTE